MRPFAVVRGPVEVLEEASDCEAVRDGILGQHANTVTSLAFVAAGLIVLDAARRQRSGDPARRLFGWLIVAIGIGSVLYHGPHPPGVRIVHDLPILGVGAFVVFVEARERRSGERWPLPRETTVVLAVCAVAAAVSWALGRTDSPLCDPEGVIQLHAFWHLFAATALGLWSLRLHRPD